MLVKICYNLLYVIRGTKNLIQQFLGFSWSHLPVCNAASYWPHTFYTRRKALKMVFGVCSIRVFSKFHWIPILATYLIVLHLTFLFQVKFVIDGLLMRGSKIFLLSTLHSSILKTLHDTGHQGISKCHEKARNLVW